MNKMWTRQQRCCGHRSSLSSAGSWLSQPHFWICWNVSLPRDRQELSQTITAAASAELPPSLAGLWALLVTRSLPMPLGISLPVFSVVLRPWRGLGVCWSWKKHLSLTRSCHNTHSPLVLLSSLHRRLQEKWALPKRGLWCLPLVGLEAVWAKVSSLHSISSYLKLSPPQLSPYLRGGMPQQCPMPTPEHRQSPVSGSGQEGPCRAGPSPRCSLPQ